MTPRRTPATLPGLLCGLVALLCLPAAAARSQPAEAGDIRELRLGLAVADLSDSRFAGIACAVPDAAGAPARDLAGWGAFRTCPADASGLREIRAGFAPPPDYDAATMPPLHTRIAGIPSILSVLLDEDGVIRGLGVATDLEAPWTDRRLAHLAERAMLTRYGPDWSCTDRPERPGFTPVGGIYIDRRCETLFRGDRRVIVETHFFRRPGQSGSSCCVPGSRRAAI